MNKSNIIDLINQTAKKFNINVKVNINDLAKTLRDINIDSLAAITIIVEIESLLNIQINDDKLKSISTLDDLVNSISELQKK
ncbi:MAG: phosphopantetheine-binding protein [Mycoplasmoidaceae bacterium]